MRAFALPPEAVKLLVEIEEKAGKLRHFCTITRPHADSFGGRLWPRPSPAEQAEWSKLAPTGGRLIHIEACIMTQGLSSEEWFMGLLFVSEAGIAAQGTSGIFLGSQEAAYSTGLLPWHTIEDIELISLEVRVHSTALPRDSDNGSLRLQLGVLAECERLKQTWYSFTSNNFHFHSFDSLEYEFGSFEKFDSAYGGDSFAGDSHFVRQVSYPLNPFHKPADLPITKSFLAASDDLPAQGAFKDTKPLCSKHIPDVTLEQIRKLFEADDDWFLLRFQKEVLKAHEVGATPWTKGKLVPGTMVRRATSLIPPPPDLPPALQKIMGFPPALDCTLIARLHCTDSQVTLFMHSCSLNAPYGDCQRLEDVLVVSDHEGGGITVSKWMKVVWVKSAPWPLRMAKGILEKKVQDDGKASFDEFNKLLRKNALAFS